MSLASLIPSISGDSYVSNTLALVANTLTLSTMFFGIFLMMASIATTTLDANNRKKRSLAPEESNMDLVGDPGGWDPMNLLLTALTYSDSFDCGKRMVCEMAAIDKENHQWTDVFRYSEMHESLKPHMKGYIKAKEVGSSSKNSCTKSYKKCPTYTSYISSFIRALL